MNSLNIAILSRGSRLYSTRRLKEAALRHGHKVRVLDTMQFGIYLESGQPDLTFRGKPVPHYNAVIPRIGNSITFLPLVTIIFF